MQAQFGTAAQAQSAPAHGDGPCRACRARVAQLKQYGSVAGYACRPLDVDLTYIYGYSFPRYRGGPMHWADEIGLPHVLERIEHYWKARDPDHLEPAPLLRQLAGEGKTFKQWSDARG